MSKSNFLLLLALVVGIYDNRTHIERWFNSSPSKVKQAVQQEVVLYSTQWCGYCAKTRQYFKENNIVYTDLDVEQSERGRKEFQALGGNGVPLVVINQEKVIHGFSQEQFDAELKE